MPPIRLLLSAAALSIATVTLPLLPSRSQSLPACEPPRPNEYLLIVVDPTEEIQTQLGNALPGNATATVCTYLTDRVLRIDGFNTPEVAQSWAQYASDASGLRTFVARPPVAAAAPAIAPTPAAIAPPATAAITPTPQPAVVPPVDPFPQPTSLAPSPAPTSAAALIAPASPAAPAPVAPTSPVAAAPATTIYNPQPLGAGYAVLVDYANRPEVAIEVRQVLSRDVGLVAYGQRPYLLAIQTPDLAAANQVLQILTRQNFTALLVDSQSAILLTPVVAKLD
ncbi:hypothetical protein H6F67_10635 [Microcoleus sp. FACHB-1515]|uniref:hypothetical protein n=1 Tax=Cyanophyceae TaxID=3028117 RepID=UPI0016870907|nr:hypothetical protein [Microcoleus sp. FACHB-1515]MBD2090309.1 hypothetical protein [Microcoleus sp. FACHB-1515]